MNQLFKRQSMFLDFLNSVVDDNRLDVTLFLNRIKKTGGHCGYPSVFNITSLAIIISVLWSAS